MKAFGEHKIEIGIWLSLYSVAFLVFSTGMAPSFAIVRATYLLGWAMALHYLNLPLMSNSFMKGRHPRFLLYASLLLLSFSFARLEVETHLLPDAARPLILKTRQPGFLFYMLGTLSAYLVSSLVLYNKFLKASEMKLLKLQQQHTNTHLALLQAQIQPHSLFNTLNNIYCLVMENKEEAGEAVLKLSEMLRYAIYMDDEQAEFPLDKEVQQIETLVWLFQLKGDTRYDITFNKQVHGGRVLPMLLVPLVENALKHCDFAVNPRAFVRIELSAEPEKIKFTVVNTHQPEPLANGIGGLGLRNVRERLDIFYPGRYVLDIEHSSSLFTVKLELRS
jgi:hypothetical protein